MTDAVNAFRPHAGRAVMSALLGLAGIALLASCGGGGSEVASVAGAPGTSPAPAPAPGPSPAPAITSPTAPPSTVSAAVIAEVSTLDAYMRNWYLWRDRMPAPDLTQYSSAAAALKALKVPEDRYSYVDDALSFNQFFDEGKTIGFGIGYASRGDTVWIRLIQPLSPAAEAGLRRGDRIVAIDGVPSAALIAQGRLDAAFGPLEAGVSASFTLERDGQILELRPTKQSYALSSVLDARVIDSNGRRVGYVNLYAFNSPARPAWLSAISTLIAGGAQDVVVDLRDNGGGLLSIAAEIASTLAPADAQGRLFMRSEYNNGHTSSNSSYSFFPQTGAGRFQNVAWLTTDRTCSASEALIVGLRPYRDMPIIGSTTCGKPVGFNPEQRDGKVYNIVTFRLVNSAGATDYFDGLMPTCPAIDDFKKPLGDPGESMLASALALLGGRPCPVQVVTKSRTGQTPAPAWDLAAQIGLK